MTVYGRKRMFLSIAKASRSGEDLSGEYECAINRRQGFTLLMVYLRFLQEDKDAQPWSQQQ